MELLLTLTTVAFLAGCIWLHFQVRASDRAVLKWKTEYSKVDLLNEVMLREECEHYDSVLKDLRARRNHGGE